MNTPAEIRGPALLHNMSAQPRTTITHRSGDDFLHGRRLVFALPPTVEPTPLPLLAALDGGSTRITSRDAEAELRQRLNLHARTLALPAAVAVIDRADAGDRVCPDLLSVLTVLAKSSPHVYLRDKEPNLAAIRRDRRVVLLLPPDGRP